MSDRQTERTERTRRLREQDDDDRFERRSYRQRVVTPPTKYVFRVNGKPKPPAEVHFDREPKLGDILSTSDGPHRVAEVYWSGGEKRGWKADVLLAPLPKKEEPAAGKDAKAAKGPQGCPTGPRGRKGPSGRNTGRKPARRQERYDSGHKATKGKGNESTK